MNRYYLLMDYLVPIIKMLDFGVESRTGPLQCSFEEKQEFYRDNPIVDAPKTKCIGSIRKEIRLYVAYHDIDVGHFVIKAKNRKQAYEFAGILRALFSLRFGWQPVDKPSYYFLQELHRIPNHEWTEERLAKEIQNASLSGAGMDIPNLREGYAINYEALQEIPIFINRVWGDSDIIETLDLMLESRFLFFGFMDGGYYQSHYRLERKYLSQWELQKKYFENRYRYETAFVAAFKGIERFFGGKQIKKGSIEDMLNSYIHTEIKPDTVYKRNFEIFSKLSQAISYKEIIKHFLDIRNCVAAHSNRKPPEKFQIIEDNIFEIQHFLDELLYKAIFKKQPKP